MPFQRGIDMCNGRIVPNLIRYVVPVMLSGVLQLLYNAADVIVVARWAGGTALAAVGSTGSLVNLIVNLFIGLSVGASVAVAQHYGAGNRKDVSESVHTAVTLSIVSGLCVAVIGVGISRTALEWMNSPADVIDQSTLYLKIYFFGAPAAMVYNFGAAILRAVGDTKRPLYILAVSGIINVVLNLILVIAFHLDVAGVAIATVTSQVFSAVMVVLCLVKTGDCYRLELKKLRIYKEKLLTILKNGIPAAIQSAVFSFSNILIQSSINSFGAAMVAANSAASNIEGFVYIGMNSMQHAALAFTAQNVGAGNVKRIRPVFWYSIMLVTAIALLMGGLVLWFHEPLLTLYTASAGTATTISAEEIIRYGTTRLWYLVVPYCFCGIMDAAVGAIRGLGVSLPTMIVSVLGVCGIRIVWTFTVFPLIGTPESLYISYPISWLFTALVQIGCYLVFSKKLIKKLETYNA